MSSWDRLPESGRRLFAAGLFGGGQSEQAARNIFESLCEELTPELAEDFFGALKSIGSKLPGLAKDLGPGVLQGAAKGASMGGPWGALIGGLAGGASSALRTSGAPAPPRSRAPALPPAASAAPPTPIANQSRQELGANLARLAQSPALLQSLVAMMAGEAGGGSVQVGGAQVNPASILNTLKVLTEQALVELNGRSESGEGLEYLAELEAEEGEGVADPMLRANAVLRLLAREPAPRAAEPRALAWLADSLGLRESREAASPWELFEAEGEWLLLLVRSGGKAFVQTVEVAYGPALGYEYGYRNGMEQCRRVGGKEGDWLPVLGFRGWLYLLSPEGAVVAKYPTIERGSSQGSYAQSWYQLPAGDYRARIELFHGARSFRIYRGAVATPVFIHSGAYPCHTSGCIIAGLKEIPSGVRDAQGALGQIFAAIGGERRDVECAFQARGYQEAAGALPEVIEGSFAEGLVSEGRA